MRTVLRRAAWRHPEWPVALAAVACWAVLAALHTRGAGPPAGHHPTASGPAGHPGGWLAAQGIWLLMAAAMMLPPALPAVRHVARNSRWRRRRRGSAVFVAGYLAVWLTAGLVVVSVADRLRLPAGGWPVVAALLVAAGWELTAVKRRCLRAGHRTWPLPPDGWRADAACARYGLRCGRSSLGAGWALMLPMALVGHTGLLLMAVLTAIVVAEEGLADGTRLTGAAALVLLAAAGLRFMPLGPGA